VTLACAKYISSFTAAGTLARLTRGPQCFLPCVVAVRCRRWSASRGDVCRLALSRHCVDNLQKLGACRRRKQSSCRPDILAAQTLFGGKLLAFVFSPRYSPEAPARGGAQRQQTIGCNWLSMCRAGYLGLHLKTGRFEHGRARSAHSRAWHGEQHQNPCADAVIGIQTVSQLDNAFVELVGLAVAVRPTEYRLAPRTVRAQWARTLGCDRR